MLPPDSIYGSRLITRLINKIMQHGKKTIAINQIYDALTIVKDKMKAESPLIILRQAVENIKPSVEVRSRRVGGAAYQIPVPVKGDRREALAIRWLVTCSRQRPNKEFHTYAEKLAAEIMDAYKNEGTTMKKKQDMHRMADANKAFAHFRW